VNLLKPNRRTGSTKRGKSSERRTNLGDKKGSEKKLNAASQARFCIHEVN
jgi:hypothetical protein